MILSTIPLLVMGLVLLFFGRKLFWLMVAASGFVAGWHLSAYLFPGISEQTQVIAGVVLGLLGAVLAFFAQKIAIWLGGFVAGGYLLVSLLRGVVESVAFPDWIPFIIGGVLCAILLNYLFDWGLIVLTSMLGAAFIVDGFDLGESLHLIALVILSVVGIVVQVRLKLKKKQE